MCAMSVKSLNRGVYTRQTVMPKNNTVDSSIDVKIVKLFWRGRIKTMEIAEEDLAT